MSRTGLSAGGGGKLSPRTRSKVLLRTKLTRIHKNTQVSELSDFRTLLSPQADPSVQGWYDGAGIAFAIVLVVLVTAVNDYKQVRTRRSRNKMRT